MEDSVPAMRVETLPYQSIPSQSAWPGLLKATAVATLLNSLSMVTNALFALWGYGFLGRRPAYMSGLEPNQSAGFLLIVFPMLCLGVGLLVSAVAVLSRAKWALTAMRTTVTIQLILLVVLAFATAANSIGIRSGPAYLVMLLLTASSLNSLLAQLGLPILTLVIIKLHRRSLHA